MWEEEVWIYDTPEVPNNFPFFKGKKYFFFFERRGKNTWQAMINGK